MIFNSTEQFALYMPVNASLTFDLLRTHISTAEYRFLKPILGPTLYALLNADFQANSTDPAHLALLDVCRKVVAPHAWHIYSPFAQVQMSDAGWRTVQDENHKAAFRWQVEKIEEASLLGGYIATEELIEFLEENYIDYPDWDYAGNHAFTINSAKAFNDFVYIDGSRMVYLKLVPFLKLAEKNVEGIISRAQMIELRSAIGMDNLTPEQEALLEKIQPVVANEAFSRGIVGLPAKFVGDSVRVFASQFPGGSEFPPNVQADASKLGHLAKIHYEQADQFRKELSDFIRENAADYPLYEASPQYRPLDTNIDETDISTGGVFFT